METQQQKQLRLQQRMDEETQKTMMHNAQKEEQRQKIMHNQMAH